MNDPMNRVIDEQLTKPGVTGANRQITQRLKKGRPVPGTAVITIHVRRKRSRPALWLMKARHPRTSIAVPRQTGLAGAVLEFDILEVGDPEAPVQMEVPPPPDPHKGFQPWVPLGVSAAHIDNTAGTSGGVLFDEHGVAKPASNNHVFGNSTSVEVRRAHKGDWATSPGPHDIREQDLGSVNDPKFRMGKYDSEVPLKKTGNRADLAWLDAIPERDWWRRFAVGYAPLTHFHETVVPEVGSTVKTSTRTTGARSMTVLGTAAEGIGSYAALTEFGGQLQFVDGITIDNGQGAIQGGSSGSMVWQTGADGVDRYVGRVHMASPTVGWIGKADNELAESGLFMCPPNGPCPTTSQDYVPPEPPPAPTVKYGPSSTDPYYVDVQDAEPNVKPSRCDWTVRLEEGDVHHVGDERGIAGRLSDPATGDGLPGRQITWGAASTQTDESGAFTFVAKLARVGPWQVPAAAFAGDA